MPPAYYKVAAFSLQGRTRATELLELVHGELVGPVPVESVSKSKYGFVLMGHRSRAQLGAPLETEIRCTNRIRKMGQPATERNQGERQNSHARQYEGAGGRKNERVMRRKGYATNAVSNYLVNYLIGTILTFTLTVSQSD